jgi:hypothetical protein
MLQLIFLYVALLLHNVQEVCCGAGPLIPNSLSATMRADVVQGAVLCSLSVMSGLSSPPPLPVRCFFVPGFQLDSSYYRLLAREIRASGAKLEFLEGPEYTSSGTIESASLLMGDEVTRRLHSKTGAMQDRVVMMGHSRGGAVAALTSLALLDRLERVSLVLLDPVDDAELSAIKTLTANRERLERFSDRITVKVLSLPYGGYSSFYRKQLTSSCAPPGRNADSFIEAFPAPIEVTREEFRDLGHMQILNDPSWEPDSESESESSSRGVYSSVCPRSDAGEARSADARLVVREWVRLISIS